MPPLSKYNASLNKSRDLSDLDLYSIVLVHGLHGHETRTWTYSSGPNSVFWPKDLLPVDAEEARVLTFGYDASIAHFWARPSENRLDSYSDDLFQQLDNNRHKIDAVTFHISFGLQSPDRELK